MYSTYTVSLSIAALFPTLPRPPFPTPGGREGAYPTSRKIPVCVREPPNAISFKKKGLQEAIARGWPTTKLFIATTIIVGYTACEITSATVDWSFFMPI